MRLSRPAPSAFTVSYTTVDGSARAGSDYIATSGTLSFAEGQEFASVAVEVNGDTLAENTERFSLVLTPPDSPSIGTGGAVGEATLLDDDTGPGPSLSIAAADPAQESFSSFLRFVVTLSEASLDAVTVNYRLRLAGTATDLDLYYARPVPPPTAR